MRSTVRPEILLLLLIGLGVHCGRGNVKELSPSLPESVAGWEAGEEAVTYDRETLYDYMNGGAEVFLAFDFQQVFVRKYSREGAHDIVLDIYEMGSPPEAFGLFSCDREDDEAGIGQGSEYGFGLLRFWKGRHFVTIQTSGDDQATEEAILELGRAVAGALGPDGEEPEILRLLPVSGLLEERTSYFHSDVNLNNRFFIASGNILDLGTETDCVIAEYGGESEQAVTLLVVRYPDSARADAAFESFIRAYMPEADESGLAQMEDGQWTLAGVRQGFLSIVFDAPTEDRARQLWSAIPFD